MDRTEELEVERPRLLRLATRVLAERGEAEDVVQQAWLRLHRTDTAIESLPAWLTTVTTRLCLDRLRARVPTPRAEVAADAAAVLASTPEHIEGSRDVARFFDGSAHAALSVFVGDRPGAAWFHRGRAVVIIDFLIIDAGVRRIVFRAEPDAVSQVTGRDGGADHHPDRSTARLQHGEEARP